MGSPSIESIRLEIQRSPISPHLTELLNELEQSPERYVDKKSKLVDRIKVCVRDIAGSMNGREKIAVEHSVDCYLERLYLL